MSAVRILVGLAAVLCSLCQAQELRVGEALSNPCINVETCGECIRTSSICAWCAADEYSKFSSRCDLVDHMKTACPSNATVAPKSFLNVVENENVQGGDGNSQPVQVQPQVMNIIARANEPIPFKLTFRQAENYPLDLYFLLDLSYTMVEEEEAQKRLIALGQEMPVSMENITKDFNLGFGTFVDKTVMPYTAWTNRMLQDRCPLEDKSCRPPHDFINQLKLSKNGPGFAEKMKDALNAVSQSFDDSEGGLDGLMQALACEEQIGWRERSRRIIVYSSNSMFHVAGDGLLGGATKNNDGECHLDSTDTYSPSDMDFDYPSISQVASKLANKSASVIFAVMPSVYKHYERFRANMGSAEIGVLQEKSSNIIKLIRNNYDKLRSRIQFLPRKADGVRFRFRSKCLGNVMKETAVCDGLEIKDSVTFDVTMTVSSDVCKGQTGVIDRKVELVAKGLNEKLEINLQVICDCQCERPGFEVTNSDRCSSGNGTFECGICNCNPGRYGRVCECSESEISSKESLEKCRKGNDTEVCSGHGECICGRCICFTLGPDIPLRYSEKFCQCNDYSCPRSKNDSTLCGGPTRGRCKCGTCKCLPGWTEDACDCREDNSTCIASNGEMCNGKGECKCGRCICNATLKFIGPTCEECLTCPTKCNQYRDCAQCKAFGTGNYNGDQCKSLCPNVTKVDSLELDNDLVRVCHYRDTDKCLFHFTYEYDKEGKVVIKVQRTKECPTEVNLALILGPVFFGIVFLPLLFLCLFIFLRNRRDAAEFARFMKEKDKAKWESAANPIYKDPKSTFKNPTYKGGN